MATNGTQFYYLFSHKVTLFPVQCSPAKVLLCPWLKIFLVVFWARVLPVMSVRESSIRLFIGQRS